MTEITSLKYGVNISKEHVRKGLLDIDLEGVSMLKKKTMKRRTYEINGSFDVFHIDGNYKIKRFGFVIRECIDGFNRKLIWLFVSTANNDPLVLQISVLELLQIWAEHEIHCEWTWVQKKFIVKNFKCFSLKTVKVFCTLHQPGTSE